MGDDAGLARAGAGEHQAGAAQVVNRFELRGIERRRRRGGGRPGLQNGTVQRQWATASNGLRRSSRPASQPSSRLAGASADAGRPMPLSFWSIEAEKVRATSALSSETKRENAPGSRSM